MQISYQDTGRIPSRQEHQGFYVSAGATGDGATTLLELLDGLGPLEAALHVSG
jgi:energy-coupling factor transporter ATP-binding protein EcfA2